MAAEGDYESASIEFTARRRERHEITACAGKLNSLHYI
jgi:hypothetical protein